MSAVDQSVWVRAGRVRRSLVRVLLVLGGALVATGVGWLLSSASASADVLPTVPLPPLSSVTDVISTPAPTLPTPPLPSTPPDLGQVAQQVHLTVSGVGARVPTVPEPAAELVPLVGTVAAPVGHPLAAPAATPPSSAVTQAVFRPGTVVAHRHSVGSHAGQRTGGTGTTQAGGPVHRLPALPPVQPAGSGDANAHGSGGAAGGAGGPQLPFVTVLGAAPHSAGRPATPRLPVAPGQQPGTSPD